MWGNACLCAWEYVCVNEMNVVQCMVIEKRETEKRENEKREKTQLYTVSGIALTHLSDR